MYNFIVVSFLITIFVLLPAIAAAGGSATPVRDFLIAASVMPTLASWATFSVFVLDSIPETITNNGNRPMLGFAVFMTWFVVMALLVPIAFTAIYIKHQNAKIRRR